MKIVTELFHSVMLKNVEWIFHDSFKKGKNNGHEFFFFNSVYTHHSSDLFVALAVGTGTWLSQPCNTPYAASPHPSLVGVR